MFHILRRDEQKKGKIAAVEFEGAEYGAGLSFFIGDLEPGRGPRLHKHPYAETCIIEAGTVSMVVDGQETIAGPGDIVTIGPQTPHRFTVIGAERLKAVCIHASERFVIEWIGEA